MFGLHARRERAAAKWLAAMGNEGRSFDRAAFERWRTHPDNARAFDEAARSWGSDLPIAATRYARDERDPAPVTSPTGWPRRATFAAVAAVLVATIAGVGYRSVNPSGPFTPAHVARGAMQVATGPGDVRAIRLGDGSIATLAGGSLLDAAFTGDVRALTLVRGRARFEVAHEATRPFQVRAGQSLITAHGTIFDVELAAGTVRVDLVRGAIDVARLQGSVPTGDVRRLSPGESVTVPAAGPISAIRPASTTNVMPMKPMLSFDRTPLATAIAAFNQRNPVKIALVGDAARGETVTGGFAADDPDGFARMLADLFKLALSRSNDALMLTAKP